MNDVLQVFPEPEAFDKNDLLSSEIWSYGSFELFFDDEKKLEMIYTDGIDHFSGGACLNLVNADFFKHLTISSFCEYLYSEQIDYRVSHHKSLGSIIIMIEQSGVELHFEPEKNLSALWKK